MKKITPLIVLIAAFFMTYSTSSQAIGLDAYVNTIYGPLHWGHADPQF
jgi:carbonic anhydrase